MERSFQAQRPATRHQGLDEDRKGDRRPASRSVILGIAAITTTAAYRRTGSPTGTAGFRDLRDGRLRLADMDTRMSAPLLSLDVAPAPHTTYMPTVLDVAPAPNQPKGAREGDGCDEEGSGLGAKLPATGRPRSALRF
jgi:hypothetical protein